VVIEYIRYAVHAERAAEFEEAYRAASSILEEDPHCLAYEVARGSEDPEHFVVRIEWDSLEGHLDGFRKSQHFRTFFGQVQPFMKEIAEMNHYVVRLRGASL
jgi:quinol monooxygenase YgiN